MAECSCDNDRKKKIWDKIKYTVCGEIYAQTKLYTKNKKTFAYCIINKFGNIVVDIQRGNKRYIIKINSEDKELGIWETSEDLKGDITKNMLEAITE